MRLLGQETAAQDHLGRHRYYRQHHRHRYRLSRWRPMENHRGYPLHHHCRHHRL